MWEIVSHAPRPALLSCGSLLHTCFFLQPAPFYRPESLGFLTFLRNAQTKGIQYRRYESVSIPESTIIIIHRYLLTEMCGTFFEGNTTVTSIQGPFPQRCLKIFQDYLQYPACLLSVFVKDDFSQTPTLPSLDPIWTRRSARLPRPPNPPGSMQAKLPDCKFGASRSSK